jgi:hypothetical protein
LEHWRWSEAHGKLAADKKVTTQGTANGFITNFITEDGF